MSAFDFDKALAAPDQVFKTPEDVLQHTELDNGQKRAVLERWLYDARELSVAEEEGMGGGEPSLTERIAAAIAELDAGDSKATVTHKH